MRAAAFAVSKRLGAVRGKGSFDEAGEKASIWAWLGRSAVGTFERESSSHESRYHILQSEEAQPA